MKKKSPETVLSRRERQMMDILYSRGRATAAEVHRQMPDPPSYSAIRAKLRVLEEKGHIRHHAQATRYIYTPVIGRDRAQQSALKHLVATFFDNSTEQALTALLELGGLSENKLDHLTALMERAREKS